MILYEEYNSLSPLLLKEIKIWASDSSYKIKYIIVANSNLAMVIGDTSSPFPYVCFHVPLTRAANINYKLPGIIRYYDIDYMDKRVKKR